jgi:hydrogenase expression/formation protein HypE
MAIMAVRAGLEFESMIESDCAPVYPLVQALLEAGMTIHCLRDLTRGGLASAVVEIAESAHLHIHLDERLIPVREDVRGACELLGLDPMYVANEGRFVCFVPAAAREEALGAAACCIGEVSADPAGLVTLQSHIGVSRIVDMLSGEQLPRIC